MSNSKYSDLIQAINETNVDSEVDIYVPSCGKFIKFTPLTIEHQKKIISTSLDATVLNTTNHAVLMSEICTDCCKEPITLYSLDRDAIAIALRCESIGYDVSVQNVSGGVVKHNIKEHVSSYKSIQKPENLLSTQTITVDKTCIKIKPPTLKNDTQVNECLIPHVSKDDLSDSKVIKNIVGSAIMYEYVKYIKSIEIGDVHVKFDYTHADQLVRVVESLPLSVSKKLLAEINKIKQYQDKFTNISHQNSTLTIVTDARFYNSE